MPTKHVVKEGETLLTIAAVHRFGDWRTIWSHGDNAGLRERRPDPMVLVAGDEVMIPDREPRWERVETNRRHVFKVEGLEARLRLLVEDELGASLHGAAWTLVTDEGRTKKGTVGARGLVDCRLPPTCRTATLTVSQGKLEITWNLQLGALQPVEEVKGVQARLSSLGYLDGRQTGEVDDATKKAIEAFQRRHGLPVNGAADDPQLRDVLLERCLA